jgi:hypothetical protein
VRGVTFNLSLAAWKRKTTTDYAVFEFDGSYAQCGTTVSTDLINDSEYSIWPSLDEGVIEEFSHRDHSAGRIVSAFVVGDRNDKRSVARDADPL